MLFSNSIYMYFLEKKEIISILHSMDILECKIHRAIENKKLNPSIL